MAILGFDVGLPDIDVGGFFSSSWVYVVIVAAIGLFLIFIIASIVLIIGVLAVLVGVWQRMRMGGGSL